jgi:hypothetical protein
MFRFTIRDGLWLIVAVIVGTTVFVMPWPRGNGGRTATRRVSEQDLEAIKIRYEAAKKEFEYYSSPYLQHRFIDECDVLERFAEAAEARDDLEARVKDLAQALEYVQGLASAALDKYENDVEPANVVYRFQYTRADMEARLRRAEQDLAAAQATW